jgi:polysaccharide biosynthesis/export protein
MIGRRRTLFAILFLCFWGAGVAAAQTTGPVADDPVYRIGAGDVLDIHVYAEDAREECLVRPDGRITLPLIGDVDAAGATPPELAERIKQKYLTFQSEPNVTVAVREIHSYRVYVLGEVAGSQMIESNTPLRLLEVIAIAGGFNEWAKKKLVVLRGQDESAQRFEIDYDELVEGKASSSRNLLLEAGDTVVVR